MNKKINIFCFASLRTLPTNLHLFQKSLLDFDFDNDIDLFYLQTYSIFKIYENVFIRAAPTGKSNTLLSLKSAIFPFGIYTNHWILAKTCTNYMISINTIGWLSMFSQIARYPEHLGTNIGPRVPGGISGCQKVISWPYPKKIWHLLILLQRLFYFL